VSRRRLGQLRTTAADGADLIYRGSLRETNLPTSSWSPDGKWKIEPSTARIFLGNGKLYYSRKETDHPLYSLYPALKWHDKHVRPRKSGRRHVHNYWKDGVIAYTASKTG